jgi:hypothetical protein
MGMKLLMSHNAIPTTISASTMFINGIFFNLLTTLKRQFRAQSRTKPL